jgi:hypothetical protein
MLKKVSSVGFFALLTLAINSHAQTIAPKPHTGFAMHLAYIASGLDNCPGGNDSCVVVDGLVVDSTGAPVDGDHFERITMGRSDAELADHKAAAIAFFADRFTDEIIQLEDGVNNEGDAWSWIEQNIFPFTFDPRSGYRAIVISEEFVPTDGYMVRDGGWQIAPGGKVGVYGEYNILREKQTRNAFVKTKSDLVIHYQSQNLINFNPDPDGPTAFDCELWLGDYDEAHPKLRGFAQGMFSARPVPNVRNILTLNDPDADYPGLGTN